MEGVKSCKTPIPESKKDCRVIVLVYRETTHSFGGATETGVAKVTIFMDVSSVDTTGHANDQTGMLMGGGGGMDGDAKPATNLFLNLTAMT